VVNDDNFSQVALLPLLGSIYVRSGGWMANLLQLPLAGQPDSEYCTLHRKGPVSAIMGSQQAQPVEDAPLAIDVRSNAFSVEERPNPLL
jgi:hypothetical protein